MNDQSENEIEQLNEQSVSVHAHLQILQSVIQRMAANSNSCKAWCITIVSALLVVISDKGKPNLAWLAMLPTFLFFALDAYYLALEKAFRSSYEMFIKKLHANKLSVNDLFTVSPRGEMTKHQLEAIKSFSVWGFYLLTSLLIFLAWDIVIK